MIRNEKLNVKGSEFILATSGQHSCVRLYREAFIRNRVDSGKCFVIRQA
jgi:hypothetical protein